MFQAFEGNGLYGAMGGHLQTWRLWQCHLVGENAGKNGKNVGKSGTNLRNFWNI
jgi:hypothetical protein